jgi:signal transduction histidine kinase/CheY-like chemotaxis protein
MDSDSDGGRTHGRSPRPWWLIHLALGLALTAAYTLLLPRDSFAAAALYTGVAVLLAVASVAAILIHRPSERAVWRLNAAAWTLNAVASGWWSFASDGSSGTLPFPSVADGFFIVTYLLLVAMLVAIARQRGGARDHGGAIDALIVTIAVGALSWAFVIQPALTSEASSVGGRLVPVGYALVDLLLLGSLVRLWFVPGVRRPAYVLLTAGMLLHLIADEGYTASVINHTFAFGDWYDPVYLLAWTLIGAAALHPSMRVLGTPDAARTPVLTRGRLAFLAAVAMLPPTVIIGEMELVGRLGPGSRVALTCVSALMSLLVVLRMRGLLVDMSKHQEMQRLKNEFTSVVSHELRTPLTSIRGSLGLMAGGALGTMPAPAQRMLEIAVNNTDRLIRLINDILDLERIESGDVPMQIEPCAANEVVDEAVRSLEGIAADAGIELEGAAADVRVSGDRDRLVQTLTNLIGNAIKFSPAGTTVRASVERAGDLALFRVEDQGRGIPPAKLDAIFEAFEQVDASDSREKSGTGLGLAISRMIVERHGGRIWAQSAIGEGSTFAFTVPVLDEDGSTPERRGPTVLLCDGDASSHEVLSAMLTRRGYRVIGAESAGEAVELAVAEQPAVVLVDLLGPGLDGWETVAALRGRPETSAIPVVILSLTLPDPGLAVDGWLEKPVEERSLFAALESTLQGEAGRLVLLVEDDRDLASVLVARLGSRGIRTLHAPTVEEAVRTARSAEPDLLVLDLGLPDGDGFDIVEALRRDNRLRSVPTVVYTARDVAAGERARLELGETAFLAKGRITVEDFEERVLDLLGRVAANEER